MSPVALRPRVSMPVWAAVAIVAAAYVVRSALRGFDFAPDLPMDGVFALVLAALVGLRLILGRASGARPGDEEAHGEVHDEDGGSRQ